jgi:hypothetical protein
MDEDLADPIERQDSLREEVALPQQDGVLLEEVVPGPFSTLGPGIEPVPLQNSPHRVPAGRFDPELLQLAHDPGVATTMFLRSCSCRGIFRKF